MCIVCVCVQVSSGYNISEADAKRIAAPLPPPMLAHNLESRSDKCFIGPALQQTVGRAARSGGAQWSSEGRSGAGGLILGSSGKTPMPSYT